MDPRLLIRPAGFTPPQQTAGNTSVSRFSPFASASGPVGGGTPPPPAACLLPAHVTTPPVAITDGGGYVYTDQDGNRLGGWNSAAERAAWLAGNPGCQAPPYVALAAPQPTPSTPVVPNTPAAPAAVVVTPWYRTTTAIALGSFALGTVAGALIFRRK